MTAAINNTSRLWISIGEIGKVRSVAITTLASTIDAARNAGCISPRTEPKEPERRTTLEDTPTTVLPFAIIICHCN